MSINNFEILDTLKRDYFFVKGKMSAFVAHTKVLDMEGQQVSIKVREAQILLT
jgi:hypothetical protein